VVLPAEGCRVPVPASPHGDGYGTIRYVGVTYCAGCVEQAAQAKLDKSFETEPVPA
jgi:hypothetical protein